MGLLLIGLFCVLLTPQPAAADISQSSTAGCSATINGQSADRPLTTEVSGRHGHTCGSVPSCYEYGEAAYREHPFLKATALTVRRIVACRPPARAGVHISTRNER